MSHKGIIQLMFQKNTNNIFFVLLLSVVQRMK